MARPVGSEIRQNIVEILGVKRTGYGYEILKWYLDIFPKCTFKSIYYHLRKGLETEEFVLKKAKIVKGDFSWGRTSERNYFSLGKKAVIRGNKKVEEYFKKKNDKI